MGEHGNQVILRVIFCSFQISPPPSAGLSPPQLAGPFPRTAQQHPAHQHAVGTRQQGMKPPTLFPTSHKTPAFRLITSLYWQREAVIWDLSLLLLWVPLTQRSSRCSGGWKDMTPFTRVAYGPTLTGPTPGTDSVPPGPAWAKDNENFHLFFSLISSKGISDLHQQLS